MPLVLEAPAKINLTLEVLGRRDDGYHAIRSVMQRITLQDRLTFEEASALTLHCSNPHLEGPENLVWKAAELLHTETGVSRGALIRLEKNIPIAAGLGGGSSDAAATLIGLNQLWQLGLSRSQLSELGARIGSDVPFFLGESPTMLVEGRGELLSPLPPLPARWIVLVKPGIGISAGAVYRAFPPSSWSDGSRTETWLLEASRTSSVPRPFNDLEAPALAVAPEASGARDALLAAGAPWALMSGSGSTYFSVFEESSDASATIHRVEPSAGARYLAAFVTL